MLPSCLYKHDPVPTKVRPCSDVNVGLCDILRLASSHMSWSVQGATRQGRGNVRKVLRCVYCGICASFAPANRTPMLMRLDLSALT